MPDSVKRYRVVDDRTFHDDGDGRVDQCGDIELATSDDPRYANGINLLSYDPTSPTDVVLADDHQERVAALEAKLAAVEAELRAWETDITAVMQREKYPPRDSRVPLRTEAVCAIESACNAGHELEDERDEARRERGQIVEYLLAHPYDCQNDPGIGCEACARENAAMEISRGEHQKEKGEWYKNHPRSE